MVFPPILFPVFLQAIICCSLKEIESGFMQNKCIQIVNTNIFFGKKTLTIFYTNSFSQQTRPCRKSFHKLRVGQISLWFLAVGIMELCFICPDGFHSLFPKFANVQDNIRFIESVLYIM